MGLAKNTYVPNPDKNSIYYTKDSIPFTWFYKTLTSATETSKTIPIEYLVFGRIGYPNFIPTGNLSSQQDSVFWKYNPTTAYGFGLHRDYFYSLDITSTNFASAAPIVGGHDRQLLPGDMPTPIAKKWGFIEDIHIAGSEKGSTRTAITIISVPSSVVELKREIVYTGETVHYISLMSYTLQYTGLITDHSHNMVADNYTRTWAPDQNQFTVNLLVDFKYTGYNLSSIEILNRDLRITTTTTGLDNLIKTICGAGYSRNMGKRVYYNGTNYVYLGSDDASESFSVWDADLGQWAVNTKIFNYPHSIAIPDINNIPQIKDFCVMKRMDGKPALIFTNSYNEQLYFYYDDSASTVNIDWRPFKSEKTKWIPESRLPSPSRVLTTNQVMDAVWDINPSGTISITDGKAFPIVSRKPTTSGLSLTVVGDTATSYYYNVSYRPSYGVSVNASGIPTLLSPSNKILYDTTLPATPERISTAGIYYIDNMSKPTYLLHMLTSAGLFSHIIYYNGRVVIKKLNSTNCIGLSSIGSHASGYYYQSVSNNIVSDKYVTTSSILPKTVSLVSDVQTNTISYNLTLNFSTTLDANNAFNSIKANNIWSVEVDDGAYTPITIQSSCVSKPDPFTVRVPLSLDSYLISHPSVNLAVTNFYLFCQVTDLPFVTMFQGTLDTRKLNLQTMLIKYYDSNSVLLNTFVLPSGGYSTDVMHMTLDTIQNGKFEIVCSGNLANVADCPLDFSTTSNDWYYDSSKAKINSFSLSKNYFSTSGTSYYTPLSLFTYGFTEPILTVQSSTAYTESAITTSSNGVQGPILTMTSYAGEKIPVYLPVISVYDNHQFVIGKLSSTTNMTDITRLSGGIHIKPNPNQLFVPSIEDNNVYRFSFNFRCGPNYLYNPGNNKGISISPVVNILSKYTLRYGGQGSVTPLYKRTITPMINKWWLVGIPRIFTASYFVMANDMMGIPRPVYKSFNDLKCEGDGVGQITTTNFTGTRCRCGLDTNAPGFTTWNDQMINYGKSYLKSDTCDWLVSHVTCSESNDSRANIGAVWTKGINVTPSGYMDFSNLTFTTTYNNQLVSSGVIDNRYYGFFFIVEDTLGNRTGIDLSAMSIRNDCLLPVQPSNYTY